LIVLGLTFDVFDGHKREVNCATVSMLSCVFLCYATNFVDFYRITCLCSDILPQSFIQVVRFCTNALLPIH